jgi:hypothetical protein
MRNVEAGRRRSACAIVAGAALSFFCAHGCDSNSIDLDREADTVMDLVTPASTSVLTDSGTVRSGMHMTRSRQVQTTLNWSEYAQWLDGQPLLGYQRSRADGRTIAFVRRLYGDELDLYVEKTTGGPPLRVKATFLSLPD